MPAWFYDVSDGAIVALSVALICGATLAAMALVRSVLGVRLGPDQAKQVMDAYRSVVSLTALVLAFSLAQAMVNLRRVEADVRREAAELTAAGHMLRQRSDAYAEELHGQLLAYGRHLVAEEWPALVRRGRSAEADAMLAAMLRTNRAAAASDPSRVGDANAFGRRLDEVASLREVRVTAAELRLPLAFWNATVLLAALCVALVSVLPWTLQHLLSALVMSAALGVLVALVGIVDAPFRGDSGVKPTELRRAVESIAAER